MEEKWWYPRTDGAAKFSNVTRAQPNTETGVPGRRPSSASDLLPCMLVLVIAPSAKIQLLQSESGAVRGEKRAGRASAEQHTEASMPGSGGRFTVTAVLQIKQVLIDAKSRNL
jgi:hypothetical protein